MFTASDTTVLSSNQGPCSQHSTRTVGDQSSRFGTHLLALAAIIATRPWGRRRLCNVHTRRRGEGVPQPFRYKRLFSPTVGVSVPPREQ